MALTPISLGVRSNPGRTGAISAARLINCYAQDAGEEGKIRFPIVACDGFEAWSSSFSAITGSGTHRGGLVLSDSAMYVASGTKIIKLDTSGSPTEIAGKASGVSITIASPAVITWIGDHGLKAGASVVLSTTGALPTGLTAGTTYYVLSSGLTNDDFQVSATPGGSAVNTSGTQSGSHVAQSSSSISASGLVTMARNRKEPNAQIGIATSDGHFYILEDDKLVDYSGLIDSLGSEGTLNSVAAIDGYFMLYFDNGEFYASSIDEGGEVDTLDFAKSESSPDGGVKVLTRGRDVILAGTQSTEFWVSSPNSEGDFPFERSDARDYGCYAAGSMVKVTHARPGSEVIDTIAMAATNSQGAFMGVVILNGYSAVVISDDAVNRSIRNETDRTTIRAFSRIEGGSVFYTIRGSTFTWEYNFATGFWHERTSDGLAFWRIIDAFTFNGMRIVADYTLAKLYKQLDDLYDASNASSLTLKHSNDNANSWLVTRTAKAISGSSNLKQRVKFNRLGQSKEDGKVFNIAISNAVMEDGTGNPITVQPPAVHAWPKRMRFFKLYIDTIPGSSQTSTPKGITGLAVDAVALAG